MRTQAHRPPRGFTMLELVMAIAILAMLIGMIFGLATQNIGLGNAVVTRQAEVSERTALFDLLREQFASLPGNARLELTSSDSGAQYLSDLTIQNVPLTFNWGGMERVAKAVQLSTVRRRSGLLDIVLRYYEDEILEETTEVGEDTRRFGPAEPFAEVVLMEEIWVFEWRALDGRTMEWSYDWDLVGRLPLQMELVFVKDPVDTDTPIRHIFWITPKQNPGVMMRQLQQRQQQPDGGTGPEQPAGEGGSGGSDGGGAGGGARPPVIDIPTGGGRRPPAGGGRGGR